MYRRNITSDFLEALEDTPVILLNGARQTGKSTFVKQLLAKTHTYYTMDDPSTLFIVKKDPLLFLESLESPTIIDEVQRIPELFLPLKKVVDEKRRPGFFVLTGSANVLALPKLADSLAGRLEIHTLWPLSQGELHGVQEDIIATLFSNAPITPGPKITLENLADKVIQGGYPEAVARTAAKRRHKWFESYLTTILEKEIRDLSNIEGLLEMPNLLKLFAARAGNLLNMAEVSRSTGIALSTLKRYIALLEKTYLLFFLPAWTKNLGKRVVKMPKVYLNDTGFLTHLAGYDRHRLLADKAFFGHVLENFVVMEIVKQATWSTLCCTLYHYRTHTNQEVDLVIELPDSRLVAIEVKLSQTIGPKDFSGIQDFEKEAGDKFHRGIVFYLGDQVLPFGPNKQIVPLSNLFHKIHDINNTIFT